MDRREPVYRTMSLHEWHLVGADGLPVLHRTVHVLRALRPGLASYPFRFDRREAEAEVRTIRGARAGTPYVDDDGLTVVDLDFLRPLAVGETASLEYETVFAWKTVPPPQVRRATRQRVERLDMRVEFDPRRRPADLQWGLWDGFGADARLRAAERVELDHDGAAHRFVDEMQGGTVGFTWTWTWTWPADLEPRLPAAGERRRGVSRQWGTAARASDRCITGRFRVASVCDARGGGDDGEIWMASAGRSTEFAAAAKQEVGSHAGVTA